jgi:hypothetical protein
MNRSNSTPIIELINFNDIPENNDTTQSTDSIYKIDPYDISIFEDYNIFDTESFHQDFMDEYEDQFDHQDKSSGYFIQIATRIPSFICQVYHSSFPSRNKLFKYIREMEYQR